MQEINNSKIKKDIKSMSLEEIIQDFVSFGLKKYKAEQVFKWLANFTCSFDEMTDLSKNLREFLNQKYKIISAKIIKKEISQDGTKKFAILFEDGSVVESVLMQYKFGNSICVSTQVGCKMRCKFCANSELNFSRNLSPSEILTQVQLISRFENINIVQNIYIFPLENIYNSVKIVYNKHITALCKRTTHEISCFQRQS